MFPLNPAAARRAAGLLLLLSLLGSPTTVSGQSPRVSLEDLVGESSSVVVGRALGQQSAWDADGKRILTRIQVVVDETVVGESATEIELVIPGGRVGNTVQEVSHMPVFADGEEVLLFVWTAPSGRKMTVGGELGKLDVVRGPDGKREVRGIGHLMRAAASGQASADVDAAAGPGRARAAVPLDTVLDRIRQARN